MTRLRFYPPAPQCRCGGARSANPHRVLVSKFGRLFRSQQQLDCQKSRSKKERCAHKFVIGVMVAPVVLRVRSVRRFVSAFRCVHCSIICLVHNRPLRCVLFYFDCFSDPVRDRALNARRVVWSRPVCWVLGRVVTGIVAAVLLAVVFAITDRKIAATQDQQRNPAAKGLGIDLVDDRIGIFWTAVGDL